MSELQLHRWPDEFAAIGFNHQQQIVAIKATALIHDRLEGGSASFRHEIKALAEASQIGIDFAGFVSAVNRCLGRNDGVVAWLLLRQWSVFSRFRGLEDREARQAIKTALTPEPDWDTFLWCSQRPARIANTVAKAA